MNCLGISLGHFIEIYEGVHKKVGKKMNLTLSKKKKKYQLINGLQRVIFLLFSLLKRRKKENSATENNNNRKRFINDQNYGYAIRRQRPENVHNDG